MEGTRKKQASPSSPLSIAWVPCTRGPVGGISAVFRRAWGGKKQQAARRSPTHPFFFAPDGTLSGCVVGSNHCGLWGGGCALIICGEEGRGSEAGDVRRAAREGGAWDASDPVSPCCAWRSHAAASPAWVLQLPQSAGCCCLSSTCATGPFSQRGQNDCVKGSCGAGVHPVHGICASSGPFCLHTPSFSSDALWAIPRGKFGPFNKLPLGQRVHRRHPRSSQSSASIPEILRSRQGN